MARAAAPPASQRCRIPRRLDCAAPCCRIAHFPPERCRMLAQPSRPRGAPRREEIVPAPRPDSQQLKGTTTLRLTIAIGRLDPHRVLGRPPLTTVPPRGGIAPAVCRPDLRPKDGGRVPSAVIYLVARLARGGLLDNRESIELQTPDLFPNTWSAPRAGARPPAATAALPLAAQVHAPGGVAESALQPPAMCLSATRPREPGPARVLTPSGFVRGAAQSPPTACRRRPGIPTHAARPAASLARPVLRLPYARNKACPGGSAGRGAALRSLCTRWAI